MKNTLRIWEMRQTLFLEKVQVFLLHWRLVWNLDPPSTLQEKRGSGEYNVTFLCLQRNIGGTIWLADMVIISPALGFLATNHLALLITPLQTYIAHLQFAEAQQATSKAWLLAEPIATASP